MSRRRKSSDTTPFDTLRLEGSLFVPELLERAASGEAAFQKEADYAIPKGLKLHDEYGRAFRIATATWQSFAPQMVRADLDAATVTRAFVIDLLRHCLGYTDLALCPAPLDANGEQRVANGGEPARRESSAPPSSFNLHPSSFRSFPVTAQASGGHLPVIIAPHNIGVDDPDPRFSIHGSGLKKKSAHQLAQEFLNASPNCLWAIVTNGKILRLLRDADTLTRPNFLEFDLETILRDDQHRYADFAALWRILHASRGGANSEWRTASGDSGSSHSPLTAHHSPPQACIWEKWKLEGHAQGLRVRDGLRDGVTQALLLLGRGFLTQPDNTGLRQRLNDGTLTTDAYFQQLLRLIYRNLFLFCAEERDLLHPPDAASSERRVASGEDVDVSSSSSRSPEEANSEWGTASGEDVRGSSSSSHSQFATHHSLSSAAARTAYATGYSLRRLRTRALRQSAHDPYGDLWQSLRIVFRGLAGGQPRLALPALGGLFAETQCPDLDSAAITNRDLLSAMRELRWFFDKKSGKRSAIDYRNMGPEELGSVYESLLELVPTLDLPGRVFGFAGITDAASSSGNARKTTGSYYTPDSLVQELIKSALDPVIADRLDKAGRMANGEWRTEEEKHDAYQLISRLGCLEPGSGPCRQNLRNDAGDATGRTLRPDQSDAPCGGVYPIEHGGGLGTPLSGGVHQLPSQVQRQPDGTGNPTDHRGAGEAAESGNRGGESCGTGDHREAVAEPGAKPSAANSEWRIASAEEASGELRMASGEDCSFHSPLATHRSPSFASTPFATRYSLFACEALLRITVCDPSCGSGHFLLAAARRLAEKLAELRAPDGAVRPDDYRHALREVASRCLYGVDINPMAVELCRVALWLETVDPGKPLGFLNHHIRPGNSLLGTTPDLIAAGLPDDTFTAIEGDDKSACAELKKRNKAERTGFGPLFAKEEDSIREKLRQAATAIEAMDDSQPAALQQKEAAFLTNETAPEYRHAKLLADLWCAAFVIKKRSEAPRSVGVPPTSSSSQSSISNPQSPILPPEYGQLIHTDDDLFGQPVSAAKATPKPKSALRTDSSNPSTPTGITTGTLREYVQGKPLPEDLESEVTQLASQYRFFHWHLAFPQVFDQGGFDCILGNPPWDEIKPEDKGFFAASDPTIANIENRAKRKTAIANLATINPNLSDAWKAYSREVIASCNLLHGSGRFEDSTEGNLNTHTLFFDLFRQSLNGGGRAGLLVPSGLATNEGTSKLFSSVMNAGQLQRFLDFENRKGFFPAVDSRFRFALVNLCGVSSGNVAPEFGFLLEDLAEICDPNRVFRLTNDDLSKVNPNTLTCPTFRTRQSAELVKFIHKRSEILIPESGLGEWGATSSRMFDMSYESGDFYTEEQEGAVPLYEGKMVSQYNHRAASVVINKSNAIRQAQSLPTSDSELRDGNFFPVPQYWVPSALLETKISDKSQSNWLLNFCGITSPTNERTCINVITPRVGAGNSLLQVYGTFSAAEATCLLGGLNSFALDYVLREKLGGLNLNHFIFRQLPVIKRTIFAQTCPWAAHPQSTIHDPPSLRDWLLPRVLELTYTAWDLEAFASDCLGEANSEWKTASGEEVRASSSSAHSPLATNHSPEAASGEDVSDFSSHSPFATHHSPEGFAGYWQRYSPHSPFAIHHSPPPFRWDEERRFLLRCELDAAFFHLYLGASGEWGVANGEDASSSAHSPLATNHSPVGASGEWGVANGEDASSSAHSPLATNHSPVGASSEWGMASSEDASSSAHSPLATNHSPVGASSEQRMASGEDVRGSSSSSSSSAHSPLAIRHSPLLSAFPTPRHAVSYIMDTFPIVKRKDEAKHGTYRTKDTILQIYDALADAMRSGVAYQTLLNPPPADPACCHPPKPQST